MCFVNEIKKKRKTKTHSLIHDHRGIIRDKDAKSDRYSRNLKYCIEVLNFR